MITRSRNVFESMSRDPDHDLNIFSTRVSGTWIKTDDSYNFDPILYLQNVTRITYKRVYVL